jgi:hypothetical protein
VIAGFGSDPVVVSRPALAEAEHGAGTGDLQKLVILTGRQHNTHLGGLDHGNKAGRSALLEQHRRPWGNAKHFDSLKGLPQVRA